MASVNVCDRTSRGKSQRLVVSNIDLHGVVSELKCLISKDINIPPSDIELVYCGQCLKDEKPVESYGVKEGSMVYALKRNHPEVDNKSEPLNDVSLRQFKTALRTALINPAYRTTVEKMLADPEALENIIATTPGLENDPVALAMLHDPELLAILINPANLNKVLESHPALAQAAMVVSVAVNEESAKAGVGTGTSTAGTYSLDRMSDDEDAMATPPQPMGAAGSAQSITASQLSAALSAATGMASTSTSGQDGGPPIISSDFFQQALLQARGARATPVDSQNLQAQLQQLRDMGISDEDVAQRALMASGGDVQGALDLIFGDGNF